MATLLTPEKVASRLGLDPEDEALLASIASVMTLALTRLSSLLKTSFDYADEREDLFFTDPMIEMPHAGLYVFRLSNGFVKSESVVVEVATSIDGPWSYVTAGTLFDYGKGFVKIAASHVESKYVRITYDYGFEDEEEVPDWLTEAALSMTVRALAFQQISDGKPELTVMRDELTMNLSDILDNKLRVSSHAILPLV